ncbi:MAG: HAD family hydrolase [Pseudomonadota bacterium]
MRIAMWSGPRNLSTAMMRSFGARSDFRVLDEPFYAAFLARTGVDHPMAAEVIADGPVDPADVARACAEEPETGHVYQKQMCHHMLSDFPTRWMDGATHAFLIRHPARVFASYRKKREFPTAQDLAFDEQAALAADLPNAAVIDSATIRAAPEPALRALCSAMGLAFDPAMLGWRPGAQATDGIWGAHWYGAVNQSTGFEGPEGPIPPVADDYRDLYERALAVYETLSARAIRVADEP